MESTRLLPSRYRHRHVRTCAALLLALPPIAGASEVTANWSDPVSGSWTSPAHWSTNPVYPNNYLSPGGITYDAVLAAAGSPYTVTLDTDISLRSLRLDSPDATLSHVAGTLTATQAIDLAGGAYSLVSGTIRNTTIVASNPDQHLTAARWYRPFGVPTYVTGATLDHVTLDADVLLNDQASLIISNPTTVAGHHITLAATDHFAPTTLDLRSLPPDAALDILLAGKSDSDTAGMNVVRSGADSLTLGPNTTIRTTTASGTVGNKYWCPTVAQGLISAETPNQTIIVTGSTLTNLGTLRATNHARLIVDGFSWTNAGTITADNGTVLLDGRFTPASIGNIALSNNGTIDIAGWLDATAVPLTLSASRPIGISSGTIYGTITSADGTPLVPHGYYGNTLSNATVNAPIILPNYDATLTVSDSVLNQPVSLPHGGDLTLAGAWTNNTSISVSNGSLTLGGTLPASLGNISLAYSTLAFAGNNCSTAILDKIAMSHSGIGLLAGATLDNTGRTLALGTPTLTILELGGGTLKGGTIAGPAVGPVVFGSSAGGTLDAVTLAAGTRILPGTSLSFTGGLTLANGVLLSLSSSETFGGAASLISSQTQSIAGTGTISFDGPSSPSSDTPRLRASSGTLTIGPDVTIRTGSSSGLIGPFIGTLTPFVIQGTVSAQTPSTSITIYCTTLTSSGSLSATNSAALSIDAHSFTNTGTITVDPTSTLVLTGGAASAPNGTIDLSGTAILDYTGPSPADAVRQQLALGRAGATGLILPEAAADPTRALAYVEASLLLRLTGSQTTTWDGQTVDATSLLLLPTVSGDANLDGQITPDDYALLDRSYARSLSNPHWTDGDFNYDGLIDQQDYLLIDTTLGQAQGFSPGFLSTRESQFGATYVSTLLAAVPEPSLFFAAYTLSLLRRRRRRL